MTTSERHFYHSAGTVSYEESRQLLVDFLTVSLKGAKTLLTYTAIHPCMTCIGNIHQMLVKIMFETQKTQNFSRNFEKKIKKSTSLLNKHFLRLPF